MAFPLRQPEFIVGLRGLSGATLLLIGFFFPTNLVLPPSFGYLKVRILPAEGGGACAVHLLVIVYIR